MKFTSLLSTVAVIYSCVCCINADGGNLRIESISECNNKIKYGAVYSDGMNSSSKYSYNVCDLAGNINSVSNGVFSVGSTSMEYCNSDMGSYFIGPNNGGCRSLVTLDGVNCNSSLGKINIMNGNKKNPVSFKFSGNGTTPVILPNIDFTDVPLIKLKDIDKVGDVKTNNIMGVIYNKDIQINGGTFKKSSPNLDELGLVLKRGVNNFEFPNGTKYRFCAGYDIPGITDVLEKRGLTITDITASHSASTCARVLSLDDINSFLNNSQAGTIVFDGRLNKYKGLHIGYDRISRTAIGQKMKKKIDDNLMHEISKLENNFIIFEIK